MGRKFVIPLLITISVFFILIVTNFSFLAISAIEGNNVFSSGYIIKLGILGGIDESCGYFGCDIVNTYNQAIDNTYGYLILETPVILDSQFKNALLEGMKKVNDWTSRIGTEANIQLEPIFSNRFYTTVAKNNYEIADFDIIQQELDKSAKTVCSDYKKLLKTELLTDELDNEFTKTFDDLCSKISTNNLFVKDGTTIKLNLPDIDVYSREYKRECQPQKLFTVGEIVDVCSSMPYTFTKKTLRLSDIDLEISEKGSHIYMALHGLGIKEVDEIPAKFEFEQLGFYVKSDENVIDADNIFETGGYYTASNDEGVVKASNGLITKKNTFQDLIFALRERKLLKSPTTKVNLGLNLLISLGIGTGSFFFMNRKKRR